MDLPGEFWLVNFRVVEFTSRALSMTTVAVVVLVMLIQRVAM